MSNNETAIDSVHVRLGGPCEGDSLVKSNSGPESATVPGENEHTRLGEPTYEKPLSKYEKSEAPVISGNDDSGDSNPNGCPPEGEPKIEEGCDHQPPVESQGF